MTKRYSVLSISALMFILAMGVTGCSSSQMGEDEFGEDVPSADAGTDAVPTADAELGDAAAAEGTETAQLEAPADPNAAPVEPQPDAALAPAPETQALAEQPQAEAPLAEAPAASPEPINTFEQPAPDASLAAAAPAATEWNNPPSDTSTEPTHHTSSASGGTESYKVRRGDTLMRIAFNHYGDLYKWRQIYEANRDKLSDPNVVPAGIVLTLENVNKPEIDRSGEKYMVKNGDTLGTISNEVYGTPKKWKRIWKKNKALIPNPNRIFAGFFLYYTMTAQDQEELDQNRQENAPAPVAQEQSTQETAQAVQSDPSPRGPASVSSTTN